MTDPIADLLTRIRNAQTARNEVVRVPYSKIKLEVAKRLKEREFLADVKEVEDNKFKEIEITLDLERSPMTLKRISKPGQRIYKSHNELEVILNGLGVEIISTPKGILTNAQAFKENVGGEVLCQVY